MTLLSRVPGYRSDFSTKSTPSRSATSRQPQADPVLPSVTATFASAQAQAISCSSKFFAAPKPARHSARVFHKIRLADLQRPSFGQSHIQGL